MTDFDANNFGVEVKCPKPRQHLRNIDDNCASYRHQAQGCMGVTGCDFWYIVSFCPDVKKKPLHIVRVQRNLTMIALIMESATNGADEVDALEQKLSDVSSYDAGKVEAIHAIAERAKYQWENVFAEQDVVTL